MLQDLTIEDRSHDHHESASHGPQAQVDSSGDVVMGTNWNLIINLYFTLCITLSCYNYWKSIEFCVLYTIGNVHQ